MMKSLIKRLIFKSGIPPSPPLEYLNEMLSFGKWIKAHSPEAVFGDRYQMFAYINSHILVNCPIAYLEFGVYRGDSIRKWTEINTNRMSKFVGFDSFEGLPERWPLFLRTVDKGVFDTKGITPKIDDERVSFVKGWFQHSLPTFVSERIHLDGRVVLHLDADLYSSTLYVLTKLHSCLVAGTVLIFDEFNAVTHEFRAFKDYASAYQVKYRVIATSGPAFQQVAIEVTT